MTISRYFSLSMNILLIFDMHDLNETLLSKETFLYLLFALIQPVIVVITFTAIYASLQSQKSDLSIRDLNPVFLSRAYLLPDTSFTVVFFCHKI